MMLVGRGLNINNKSGVSSTGWGGGTEKRELSVFLTCVSHRVARIISSNDFLGDSVLWCLALP